MTTKKSKPMQKQTDHTGTPFTGVLKVDATAAAALLVDLPPGAVRGLRRTGPGIDGVTAELAASMPTEGTPAGVSPAAYQAFLTCNGNLTLLAGIEGSASKLAEVVAETMAVIEDAREQALSQIVDSVRSTAKRKKSAAVLAPFQKTIAYKGQAADKAVKTKAKKAAAKAATPPAPGGTGQGATPATPPAKPT